MEGFKPLTAEQVDDFVAQMETFGDETPDLAELLLTTQHLYKELESIIVEFLEWHTEVKKSYVVGVPAWGTWKDLAEEFWAYRNKKKGEQCDS